MNRKYLISVLTALLAVSAFFSNAAVNPESSITCREAEPGITNQWIAFRKDIRLDQVPQEAIARIAADSKYWLWINGEAAVFEGSLKRGPNPRDSYYDEIDLVPFLRKGENRIALLLWYFGRQGFSHKDSGQAQLYFDCPAAGIKTDSSWICRVHPAFGTAQCPPPNYRLPESSISFDARNDIPLWQTIPSEDLAAELGFAPAETVESTLGALHPRPIPFWKDFGIKKARFTTSRGPESDTLVARLPHNMQMTPVLSVSDRTGGHRILIETDHAFIGSTENLRAEYITTTGKQTCESLGWLSGSKIILTVPHGVKINAIKYRETGYETEPEGSFSCEDPFFNRFWQKALRTIYVNARDTFFDCPERERAQWWGDIVVIMGECFHSYSTSLHALIRKGLRELCDWQKEDGSLYAPIPSGNWSKELPVQSLAAVGKYGLWSYYLHTGDRETLEYCYSAVKRYLEQYVIAPDGLTEYRTAGWNWGDWGDNRDMRLLQTTWYCIALEGALNMAQLFGYEDDAQEWKENLDEVRCAVNELCWTPEGYRHPAYEGETDDRVQALAVLGGIAGPDKYDALYEAFCREYHASSFMEKYVMEALFVIGHGDFALERARQRYDFMVNHPDFDTLFESWEVGVKDWRCGSVNHAWSGGILAVLPEKLMGVYPLEAGWKRFAVKPVAGIMDNYELSFPTVAGTVATKLKSRRGVRSWTICVPEGSEAEVSIPWEYRKCSVDHSPCKEKNIILGPGVHKIRIK